MIRVRKRAFSPCLASLEGRCLLSATPAAAWLGQDGHDLAGGATLGVGNGVQDVHIILSGLPSGESIHSVLLLGYGGGGWNINAGVYKPEFSGEMIRASGSTTADLYVDPYVTETGRYFDVVLNYADNSSVTFGMNGGTADPNLRMPSSVVSAHWLGQDGVDMTGSSPAVGPDGFQDADLALTNLYASSSIIAISVIDVSGHGWAYGLNPGLLNNAEFVRNSSDPTRGELYFNPSADLSGTSVTINVTYGDGKTDFTSLTLGHTNPTLAMPAPSPVSLNWTKLQGTWIGQDGLNLSGSGDVHLAIDGIPNGRTVASATLNDQAGTAWTYISPGATASQADPFAMTLAFKSSAVAGRADLTFPPVRSETGETLTLVLLLDDGSHLATRMAGGAADPGLRAPDIAPTIIIAHPGDDLNVLANQYGTVQLTAGVYPLSQPLILYHPVDLTADPGVTLLFSQAASAPAWTTAIKVKASHTTLSGFAVRFAGSINWNQTVSFGPSVVGTTDNLDPNASDPLVDLTFTGLDVRASAPATSWEEATQLFRLVSASSGQVTNNVLNGGSTQLMHGPWQVTGNTYLGTLPDTFSYGVFATRSTHDVTFSNNLVTPTGGAGKTWRFLVMTGSGVGDVVLDNIARGIGPMDSDTVPNPNASEIVLTEAYLIHFEGVPTSVSADGLVVQIPSLQAGSARTGDVVAILSGPQAGQWRTISQVIGPSTYLLDSGVSPGRFAISIATGFVDETYQGNTIDARGSSTALDFVLAGNQFGAKVQGNHWLGGMQAFQVTAFPSETPNLWGWTRAPILGLTFQGNTVEDTLLGGLLEVQHSGYMKTETGRVYFSGSFVNNTGVWSADYLAARAQSSVTEPPTLVTIGDALSADPGELVLTASGNTVTGPGNFATSPTMSVLSALFNGAVARNQSLVLPAASVLRTETRDPVTVPEKTAPAKIIAPEAVPVPSTQAPRRTASIAAGPMPVATEKRHTGKHPLGPKRTSETPSERGRSPHTRLLSREPHRPAHIRAASGRHGKRAD